MISPILCVEDGAEQRTLIQAILDHFGFHVRTTENAHQALELILDSDFQLALLDYDLPDMTGAQLAQEIRAITPEMRLIVLSGRVDLPAGELTYVDAHVAKGSPISELMETICSLLPQYRKHVPLLGLMRTQMLRTDNGRCRTQ